MLTGGAQTVATGEPGWPRASAGCRPSCAPRASSLLLQSLCPPGTQGRLMTLLRQVRRRSRLGPLPSMPVFAGQPCSSLSAGKRRAQVFTGLGIRILGLCRPDDCFRPPFSSGCWSPLLAHPEHEGVIRVKSRGVLGPTSGVLVGGGHHAAERPRVPLGGELVRTCVRSACTEPL